jgi:hypothetical protein
MLYDLEKFLNSFSFSNKILLGYPCDVFLIDSDNQIVPAWSSASSIYINKNIYGEKVTKEELLIIRGLIFHELSHIMFSPRIGSRLIRLVDSNNLWNEFLMLEDQRIENLLIQKYPSTEKWFLNTAVWFLSLNAKNLNNSYPLLCGRKFLPKNILDKSKEMFDKNVHDVEFIYEEYSKLNLKNDYLKAFDLISLYSKYKNNNPDPYYHTNRRENGIQSSYIRPLNDTYINKNINIKLENDNDVEKDFKKIELIALTLEPSKPLLIFEENKIFSEKIKKEFFDIYIILSKILKNNKIKNGNWKKKQPFGKFNINNFLNNNNYKKWFDFWEVKKIKENHTIVVVDSSSSMSLEFNDVFQLAWVIKESVSFNKNSCEIFSFNDKVTLIKTDKQYVHKTLFNGKTKINNVLNFCKNSIRSNFNKNNYIIVLSDCIWDEDPNIILNYFKSLKCKTILIYFNKELINLNFDQKNKLINNHDIIEIMKGFYE